VLATCTGGSYRVHITGTRPDGAAVDYETTIFWGNWGSGPKYGNGGNNGYVGIHAVCDGWAADFYSGSGFNFSTQEPDPSPSKNVCLSDDPAVTPRRTSRFKKLDSCDISYDGSITVFGSVNRKFAFFQLNMSVTKIESMTAAADVKQPIINPFP
jgi:hypothetical protein